MLLDLLQLHFVLQSLKNLVLRRNFVLDCHQLLLEYLFTLFCLCELFPENCIAAQLLLQVINLVVMLLLAHSFA